MNQSIAAHNTSFLFSLGTRSPTIIHLPKAIDKITILNSYDEEMNTRKMRIEYKPDSSPLEDGKTKYVTCFDKDEKLKTKSNTVHGTERTQHKGGRGRGRGGRGRGRGGRGRGGRGGRR